jgi:hypothetical protein
MGLEGIQQALVTMGQAMLGVIGRLDELIDIGKEIRDELKKQNNN